MGDEQGLLVHERKKSAREHEACEYGNQRASRNRHCLLLWEIVFQRWGPISCRRQSEKNGAVGHVFGDAWRGLLWWPLGISQFVCYSNLSFKERSLTVWGLVLPFSNWIRPCNPVKIGLTPSLFFLMKPDISFIFSNVPVVKTLTTPTLEKMKQMIRFIRKKIEG